MNKFVMFSVVAAATILVEARPPNPEDVGRSSSPSLPNMEKMNKRSADTVQSTPEITTLAPKRPVAHVYFPYENHFTKRAVSPTQSPPQETPTTQNVPWIVDEKEQKPTTTEAKELEQSQPRLKRQGTKGQEDPLMETAATGLVFRPLFKSRDSDLQRRRSKRSALELSAGDDFVFPVVRLRFKRLTAQRSLVDDFVFPANSFVIPSAPRQSRSATKDVEGILIPIYADDDQTAEVKRTARSLDLLSLNNDDFVFPVGLSSASDDDFVFPAGDDLTPAASESDLLGAFSSLVSDFQDFSRFFVDNLVVLYPESPTKTDELVLP